MATCNCLFSFVREWKVTGLVIRNLRQNKKVTAILILAKFGQEPPPTPPPPPQSPSLSRPMFG